MKTTDVLVIGGSAAGMVAAVTGKANFPEKKITLVKKSLDVMIPCGIPYIFGSLSGSDKNLMPVNMMMEKSGIECFVDEVTEIFTDKKYVTFTNSEPIAYDRLIIATGSTPIVPGWLEGAHLENVFVIPKDKNYLDSMVQKLAGKKKIAVIGAGFIGVELSDELNKKGFEITLIEKMPNILSAAFDPEVAVNIHQLVESRGVKIITGKGIRKIIGETSVKGVELENGVILEMDAIILSMGYAPNTELAKNAGIEIDNSGFIAVDEYMRTFTSDIFAVGDCAQKRDFVTRRRVSTMLASTACAEARIAGMNLFDLQVVKTFSGTIAIYSTAIDDFGFGTAGVTEQLALKDGIMAITGMFEGFNRHPGALPGSHKQIVKLIAAKNSGVIIGGEVIGGPETGELTNVIGLAIQNRMSVNSLLTMQIGTHPMLTASPAAYPLIKAAEIISQKIRNKTRLI